MEVRPLTQSEREELLDETRQYHAAATLEEMPLFIAEQEGGVVGYGKTEDEARKDCRP